LETEDTLDFLRVDRPGAVLGEAFHVVRTEVEQLLHLCVHLPNPINRDRKGVGLFHCTEGDHAGAKSRRDRTTDLVRGPVVTAGVDCPAIDEEDVTGFHFDN